MDARGFLKVPNANLAEVVRALVTTLVVFTGCGILFFCLFVCFLFFLSSCQGYILNSKCCLESHSDPEKGRIILCLDQQKEDGRSHITQRWMSSRLLSWWQPQHVPCVQWGFGFLFWDLTVTIEPCFLGFPLPISVHTDKNFCPLTFSSS